ncbi:MAG: hypothetical protein LBC74_14855 [Planctomycetaceae bacterium]|jgi:hypothetical protein|nr:hypothetical protein [Planctomycetaceae bacterium]
MKMYQKYFKIQRREISNVGGLISKPVLVAQSASENSFKTDKNYSQAKNNKSLIYEYMRLEKLILVAVKLFFVLLFVQILDSGFLLQKITCAAENNTVNKKQATRVLKLDNTATTDVKLEEIVLNNPELVELTLGGTVITDAGLDYLVQLKKLRKVRLSNTVITDAAGEKLAKISTLQDIDVSQTAFGDAGLAALKTLTKLKNLNLYLTEVTDAGVGVLKDFASVKTITRLNLDLCRISNTGVRNILDVVNLEWLHLGGTEITDEVIEDVVKFKKLKEIIVTKTAVTKSGAENLRKKITDCKVQDNISNNITPEQIKQAKELRQKKNKNKNK